MARSKAPQRGERHGVAHLIGDAQRPGLLLVVRQPDHLRRDVDAHDLGSAPLLELPGVEADAASQIQDAVPGECTHHAEDRITLGPLQRGRPRGLVDLCPKPFDLGSLG